jgi:dTDP-4-amino-4,6-dideoxygalactose transaminase
MQMYKMEMNNVIASLQGYIESCFQQSSMQSQHLSGAGATYLFEQKLKDYYNKKYIITYCNATTALQALCLALDLTNTEILTSPINWGGAVAPFLLHQNKLRFSAFDPVSLNLSPDDLSQSVTPKSKTVLSVDFNGIAVDSESIKKRCIENNLIYISDSSQSFGAFFKDKPAGYYADAVVLSFTAGKTVYGGEGGAVVTNDDQIYENLIFYSMHPMRQKSVLGLSNYNKYTPINGRLNPLSAILLNESFQFSLDNLRKYQSKCFNLLTLLQENNMVDEETKHSFKNFQSSTFFNFTLPFKPGLNDKIISKFLKDSNQPFVAVDSNLYLIPFESQFRKQYRGSFSCSEHLLNQKSETFRNYFKLIPIHK